MTKWTSLALITGTMVAGAGTLGCESEAPIVLTEDGQRVLPAGSLKLALEVGDTTIGTVSAILSGGNGFETQRHEIDVSGEHGVISIFFGRLPAGNDYDIELTAGDCTGSASFAIEADQIARVEVPLYCGSEAPATGSVQITGSIQPGSGVVCDHILSIVAAPSIQDGSGPVSTVEVMLNPGVTPTSISWATSSTDGASGIVSGRSDDVDSVVNVDCRSNGTLSVIARVSGECDGEEVCSEQAVAKIECRNQGTTAAAATTDETVDDEFVDAESDESDESGSDEPVVTVDEACASCTQAYCAAERTSVEASLATVAPILACLLGPNWAASERVAESSCANWDLTTCYCGTVPTRDCVDAAPQVLDGPCVAPILASTGCGSSSCALATFANPASPNGKAALYAQCQQDHCYDLCFNP